MRALISRTRANFDFEILETLEAGIVLSGTEAKAIRSGRGELQGSHVVIRGNEAFLVGASIPAYQVSNLPPGGHEAERTRKLLLNQKEIAHLEAVEGQKGLTIVPIMMYNSKRNIKVQIAVVRGKKKYDKREVIKKRETSRMIDRTLKNQY